jgi:hypothetical protein
MNRYDKREPVGKVPQESRAGVSDTYLAALPAIN